MLNRDLLSRVEIPCFSYREKNRVKTLLEKILTFQPLEGLELEMPAGESDNVYTIGKFSRVGMVSSKTLRFYDEIGLLKPCYIDEWNGYRYYSEEQVADIYFISEMREYGFSLVEIKLLMKSDQNALEKALKRRLDELFREEQKITYIRRKLKSKIEKIKRNDDIMEIVDNYSAETMGVKVITLEKSIKTAGISLLIPQWPPEDIDIFGNLWTRYWEEDISSKIPHRKFPPVRFGILTHIEGAIYYMVTDEVEADEEIPGDIVRFEIPRGKYAVCTFNARTFEELVTVSLNKANDYMTGIWLPKSNYQHAGTLALEVYDERSRRKDYPEMDIYAPLLEA